jgi:hypothetical protein
MGLYNEILPKHKKLMFVYEQPPIIKQPKMQPFQNVIIMSVWFLVALVVSSTVSSFDSAYVCHQHNLRAQNTSVAQIGNDNSQIPNIETSAAYHLRHVIRI